MLHWLSFKKKHLPSFGFFISKQYGALSLICSTKSFIGKLISAEMSLASDSRSKMCLAFCLVSPQHKPHLLQPKSKLFGYVKSTFVNRYQFSVWHKNFSHYFWFLRAVYHGGLHHIGTIYRGFSQVFSGTLHPYSGLDMLSDWYPKRKRERR